MVVDTGFRQAATSWSDWSGDWSDFRLKVAKRDRRKVATCFWKTGCDMQRN
jgi:hypothetical protein